MLLSRFVKCAALSVFVVLASAGGTAHALSVLGRIG